MAEVKSGLEGVVVAQSRMSKVLGDVGRLIYSGYEIHDLAEQASFDQHDFLSMNLIFDEPVRFFPRHGRPTYIYSNSRFGYMNVFEFEERRGEYRVIRQYLLPHPAAE